VADNGWQRKFEDPIPLPDGRKLITLRGSRRLHHQPAEEGIRPAGMANGDRGSDARVTRRSDDDGADRGHEGTEPSRRAGLQSRAQGKRKLMRKQ